MRNFDKAGDDGWTFSRDRVISQFSRSAKRWPRDRSTKPFEFRFVGNNFAKHGKTEHWNWRFVMNFKRRESNAIKYITRAITQHWPLDTQWRLVAFPEPKSTVTSPQVNTRIQKRYFSTYPLSTIQHWQRNSYPIIRRRVKMNKLTRCLVGAQCFRYRFTHPTSVSFVIKIWISINIRNYQGRQRVLSTQPQVQAAPCYINTGDEPMIIR